MEVTKSKAAEILGISTAEVLRKVDRKELKGHRKTSSKFSDWIIELPDTLTTNEVTKKVEEALHVQIEPVLPILPTEIIKKEETIMSEQEEKKPKEQVEVEEEEPTEEEIEEIEEEKHDDAKPETRDGNKIDKRDEEPKWWW